MKFYQTEAEFLETKRKIFGGSEVNTILGKSKYETPYQLFMNKLHGVLKDGNKFMDAGKMLERSIIERFYKNRNLEYVSDNLGILSFSHPKYEFIVVHPDNIFNETHLLEIKTGQKYVTEKTVDEYMKDMYFPQWNFTLGVMLENDPELYSENGYIVLFSRGIDYFEVPLKFDKNLYEEALTAVCEFKTRLDNNDPPPLQDQDLAHAYVKSDGTTIDANTKDIDKFKQLVDLSKRVDALTDDLEEVKSYFKRRLENSERMIYPDTRKTMVSWRSTAKGRLFKTYEDGIT